MKKRLSLFPLLLALAAPPVTAREADAAPPPSSGQAVTLPAAITTPFTGRFNGKTVRYDARVEPVDATGGDGQPSARLVAISYVAQKAKADRPVLFIFNGGPISPSHILHMGALGPKRVAVPDDIKAPPASFRLVDNPYTLLDVADLVFFDPAGTGFSRLAPGVDPQSQFGNVADSRQLASLVVEWTRAHGRTAAPLYLVGESYGTLRAPEAAQQLQALGVDVAGIVLLGQAVNIIEYAQRPGNIISYAVSMPTLAAIAWSHGKADARGRDFDRFMADVRDFSANIYLPVLFQGDTAPIDTRRAVAARLEEFTGLPADWYLANQLRITKVDYQRRLLPGQRLATNDARYAGPADGPDPFEIVPNSYAELFRHYLASDLRAGAVGDYVTQSPFRGGLNGWDWGPNKSPFGDWPYGRAISGLFDGNPDFRLFVANGWTDTQTTVGAMDYLLAQSGWPRARLRAATYPGGHMPYTIEASLKAFTDDVRAMVERKW
ncbi:MAG: peptidase S10 [Alphaproteobacteria bacterium HGW-Alphaproteobacteria-13]|jgi:hypothetical protein|nr:MAG: peptidase S10 [Alphaproteobacteria bacterium HGW-Alphaproteobacteria-13]